MKRVEINRGWTFFKSGGEPSEVDLPHTWYRDDDQYRGEAAYRKTVDAPVCGRLILELGAADHTVTAYANGVKLGVHKGGYSRVRFEIPPECVCGGRAELELRVDNSAVPDVSPLAGDFTVFGGLTRGAALLACGENRFDYLYHATDGVIARAYVNGAGDGVLDLEPHAVVTGKAVVRYTLRDPEGAVAARFEGASDAPASRIVPSPRLWDGRRDPALYTLTAELIADGQVADVTELKTGFRGIRADSDDGFFLNGRHMRLNGAAIHQDFAGCYSAVTEKEIDRNFELIREVGANALRLSHYQHPQYTYDRCDELGYVVWAEIPMLKMTESPELLENARSQLTELILQNIHHPSICFWGVQNEIGMFRDAPFVHEGVRELVKVCGALDPGRIVACANLNTVKSKSVLNRLTPMVGYNVYFGWYYGKMEDYDPFLDKLHRDLPGTALGVSEYGVDCAAWLHSEDPLVKDYSEEFQALWHETVYPVIDSKPYLWGSFIWNLFDFSSSRRDEGGQKYINAKGLVTFDRETKKDAFYYYKARWSEEPFLHIRGKRFVKRCRDRVDVRVYTNLPEAVLRLSDGTKIRARNDGNGSVVFPAMELSEGRTAFTVTAEFQGRVFEDSVVFEKVPEPEQSYVLPDSGAGETVKNWFLDEADLDTDAYYSLEDTAQEIMDSPEAYPVLKKHLPGLCAVLERGVVPLGLAMSNILERETPEGADLKALNAELMRIAK